GRADVAFAAGADGVHLPSDGMPASTVREILGGDAIIGQSVHSVEEARQVSGSGVDYIELGTIFPSRSHPDGPVLGLAPVREAASFGTPVLAVGGISATNIASVIEAGAAGVAVISAILVESD